MKFRMKSGVMWLLEKMLICFGGYMVLKARNETFSLLFSGYRGGQVVLGQDLEILKR